MFSLASFSQTEMSMFRSEKGIGDKSKSSEINESKIEGISLSNKKSEAGLLVIPPKEVEKKNIDNNAKIESSSKK